MPVQAPGLGASLLLERPNRTEPVWEGSLVPPGCPWPKMRPVRQAHAEARGHMAQCCQPRVAISPKLCPARLWHERRSRRRLHGLPSSRPPSSVGLRRAWHSRDGPLLATGCRWWAHQSRWHPAELAQGCVWPLPSPARHGPAVQAVGPGTGAEHAGFLFFPSPGRCGDGKEPPTCTFQPRLCDLPSID